MREALTKVNWAILLTSYISLLIHPWFANVWWVSDKAVDFAKLQYSFNKRQCCHCPTIVGISSGSRLAGRLIVLMLTARDAFEDKAQGFGQGADDYVTKSFEFR
jgi:hypothetical protein